MIYHQYLHFSVCFGRLSFALSLVIYAFYGICKAGLWILGSSSYMDLVKWPRWSTVLCSVPLQKHAVKRRIKDLHRFQRISLNFCVVLTTASQVFGCSVSLFRDWDSGVRVVVCLKHTEIEISVLHELDFVFTLHCLNLLI